MCFSCFGSGNSYFACWLTVTLSWLMMKFDLNRDIINVLSDYWTFAAIKVKMSAVKQPPILYDKGL